MEWGFVFWEGGHVVDSLVEFRSSKQMREESF